MVGSFLALDMDEVIVLVSCDRCFPFHAQLLRECFFDPEQSSAQSINQANKQTHFFRMTLLTVEGIYQIQTVGGTFLKV